MSSLSIKSHNRSITSCTCFMHFPCFNTRMAKSGKNPESQQILTPFSITFLNSTSCKVCFANRYKFADLLTHSLVTEAHSAGFSFAKEKETAIGLDEGRTCTIFPSAAHFTGVLRLCTRLMQFVLYLCKKEF